MTEQDEIYGDILPESVREQLKHIPLAAVRRAFPDRRPGACTHPEERLQPYTAMSDLCLDCGRIIPK